MEVIRTIKEMNAATTAIKRSGRPLALVPTMGALHDGHATLMRRAHESDAAVVVSIYVNPTQFGPKEDFTKYPRTLEADCQICEREGAAVVFAPADNEMYPDGQPRLRGRGQSAISTWVEELEVAKRLEGERRPGHFRGVCTVVAKLFNIVQPDRAYFGQKDYQQLKVIQRMARDLCYPIEIVAMPTVREVGGLALSSRNRYLSELERVQATVLWKSLNTARGLFISGECNPKRLQTAMAKVVAAVPSACLDYAEVVDGETLEPVSAVEDGNVALIAAFVGKTRLIDNLAL
ncbi:MAG: pantoate--beta-alanine ligase [Verrucomicrobiia bacterium]